MGLIIASPAFAASDVSDSSSLSNQATGSTAATVASTQTATIISSGATGGFGGGSGGFGAGGSGGFGGGGGGGGTGGTGGGGSGGFGDGQQSFDMRVNGQAAGSEASRLGIWAQGLYANVSKSEPSLELHGDVYNVLGGIDYQAFERVRFGLALGYEHVDLITDYNDGTYSDDGFTLAPYVAFTLAPGWVLDASAGYTWLDYSSSSDNGATEGDFGGGRWFVNSNLTANFAYESWRLQPRMSVLYMQENQDSYIDNTGTRVASGSFGLGRLSVGGKVGYDLGGGILPYAKLIGEWDFIQPDAVLKSNGEYSYDDEFGGIAGLGVEVYTNGFVISAEADYSSLGREGLDIWTIIGRVRYDF